MAQTEAERIEAAWRGLKRGSIELTPETICRQAQAVGQIAACDDKHLVLVAQNGLRLSATTDSGHFDHATAERVLKALHASD